MSVDDMAEFYVHTAKVEPFLGAGANGPVFGPAVILSPDSTPPNGVFADDSRKLVRDRNGAQVVSETTLYTYPANARLFKVGSRVTVLNDADEDDLDPTPAYVIKANSNTSGGLDLPDHLAVTLT
jgi:hypothetical protein